MVPRPRSREWQCPPRSPTDARWTGTAADRPDPASFAGHQPYPAPQDLQHRYPGSIMRGQLHASPKRQQRRLERTARARDQAQRRPTSGPPAVRSSNLVARAARSAPGQAQDPGWLGLGHRPLRSSVLGHEPPGVVPRGAAGRSANALTSLAAGPWDSSVAGRAPHLQTRRSAAMDRQVRQRPDGLDRSDRPLGQVGEAIGASWWTWPSRVSSPRPETATTSTSTWSLRCDRPGEPDQVGLQVLPIQPPPRPWMVPTRRQAG
jgi:hypothetical protein